MPGILRLAPPARVGGSPYPCPYRGARGMLRGALQDADSARPDRGAPIDGGETRMIRRTVLAVAAAATLALPATAAAAGGPDLKECTRSIGATVAALIWGEWQSPECP